MLRDLASGPCFRLVKLTLDNPSSEENLDEIPGLLKGLFSPTSFIRRHLQELSLFGVPCALALGNALAQANSPVGLRSLYFESPDTSSVDERDVLFAIVLQHAPLLEVLHFVGEAVSKASLVALTRYYQNLANERSSLPLAVVSFSLEIDDCATDLALDSLCLAIRQQNDSSLVDCPSQRHCRREYVRSVTCSSSYSGAAGLISSNIETVDIGVFDASQQSLLCQSLSAALNTQIADALNSTHAPCVIPQIRHLAVMLHGGDGWPVDHAWSKLVRSALCHPSLTKLSMSNPLHFGVGDTCFSDLCSAIASPWCTLEILGLGSCSFARSDKDDPDANGIVAVVKLLEAMTLNRSVRALNVHFGFCAKTDRRTVKNWHALATLVRQNVTLDTLEIQFNGNSNEPFSLEIPVLIGAMVALTDAFRLNRTITSLLFWRAPLWALYVGGAFAFSDNRTLTHVSGSDTDKTLFDRIEFLLRRNQVCPPFPFAESVDIFLCSSGEGADRKVELVNDRRGGRVCSRQQRPRPASLPLHPPPPHTLPHHTTRRKHLLSPPPQ
jgi:hypothetical protein